MSKQHNNILFELIQSMSQVEKAYFIKFYKEQGFTKKVNYLELFKIIDSQKIYDESALKTTLAPSFKTADFPKYKHYLYKLIIKSLLACHSKVSAKSIIRDELKGLELLYYKGLYNHCFAFLKRAKKLALQYHINTYLIEIYRWEETLMMRNLNVKKDIVLLENNYKQQKQAIRNLDNLLEFFNHRNKQQVLDRKYSEKINSKAYLLEIEKFYHHELVQDKSKATNLKTKIIQVELTASYMNISNKSEAAYQARERALKLFDNQQKIQYLEDQWYYITLYNFLLSEIDTNRYTDAFITLQKLKTLKSSNPFLQYAIFFDTYNAELMLCIKTGDIQRGLKLVAQNQKRTKKLSKEQNFLYHILLNQFYIAQLYWISEDYTNGIEAINRFTQYPAKQYVPELHNNINLMSMFFHLELNNLFYLEYRTESLKKIFQRTKTNSPLHEAVFTFFRDYLKRTNEKDKQRNDKMFNILKNSIIALQEQNIRSEIDSNILFWIEAKLNKSTIQDEIIKHHSKKP